MSLSIVSNTIVIDDEELIELIVDSVLSNIIEDEQFQLDLKEGTYTFDDNLLCDLAEEQIDLHLANPVHTRLMVKLEELIQSKDHSYDWEFEGEE